MISLLVGGGVKILVNHLLVADPAVGIKGAPIGTLCCYVTITAINLLAIRAAVPERPAYLKTFLPAVGATAVMALAARGGYALFIRLLPGSSLATLGAIALAVAVYAAAALLLGAVKREDVLALPKGEKLAEVLPMK